MAAAVFDLTGAPADVSATCRRQVFLYTGPSSYTAGGEPFDPMALRMGKIFAILGGHITNGTLVLLATFVQGVGAGNPKLFLTVPNTGAQFSGDASGYSGYLEAIGQ